MTTPIEGAVAEAIHMERAWLAAAAFGVPDDALDEAESAIARAAINALAAQGDVSDEVDRIASLIASHGHYSEAEKFRALLAQAQAVNLARANDVEALNAAVDRLRIWKGEAVEVLASWDAAWESLPAEMHDDPLILGRRKSEVVAQYVRDLYRENRDLYEYGAGTVVAREAVARAEAAEAERDALRALVADGIEAFRLTREYVQPKVLLPSRVGWSWFDWVAKARAALEGDNA